MSVLLMEGWDGVTAADLTSAFNLSRTATSGSRAIVAGRDATLNAGAVQVGTGLTSDFLRYLFTSGAKRYAGFSMKFTTVAAEVNLFGFLSGITTGPSVRRNAAGQLILKGGASNTILATSSIIMSPDTWYSCQIGFEYPGAGNPTCTVKVNGIDAFVYTGSLGALTVVDRLSLGTSGANAACAPGLTFDNLWITDDTGPDAVGFLGDQIVELQLPSSTIASSGTTLTGAATVHEAVDDATQNQLTDYVSTATIGAGATVGGLTALSAGAINVTAVQVDIVASKSDAAARTLRVLQSDGTNTEFSGNLTPSQTQFAYLGPFVRTRAPDGTAWTAGGVNSLRIGWEVTA